MSFQGFAGRIIFVPSSDCEFSARNGGDRTRPSRDAGPSCPSRSRRPVGASQADGPGVRFGKRGADFSSTSSEFKSLGAFFCNVVSLSFLRLLSRSGHRRPCTISCGYEGFRAIPFPGADSIFSSCCGAISGRLLFAVSLSRRDPGDRAWELRNQPKSPSLSVEVLRRAVFMLFQAVTRLSKTGAFISRVVYPLTQRGIPADQRGLENFKNHSSIDFVFQKEKSTPPIENRLQGHVSREAITDRATLGDPSDLSPHWQFTAPFRHGRLRARPRRPTRAGSGNSRICPLPGWHRLSPHGARCAASCRRGR